MDLMMKLHSSLVRTLNKEEAEALFLHAIMLLVCLEYGRLCQSLKHGGVVQGIPTALLGIFLEPVDFTQERAEKLWRY